MKLLAAGVRVFVAAEPIDLRRGHDGLAALVRAQWGDELFAGHLFAFFGRRLDRCKILFWDRGGLVLYYKRLERGRFRPPSITSDGKAVEMDMTALAMLLDVWRLLGHTTPDRGTGRPGDDGAPGRRVCTRRAWRHQRRYRAPRRSGCYGT